jgi:hypothetical protein
MIIPADDDSKPSYANIMIDGKLVQYTGTEKRSRPKPIFEVKIHSGLFNKNYKAEFCVSRWHTAITKAVELFSDYGKKEMPKRLLVSIQKK